jgi:hypothetical protein
MVASSLAQITLMATAASALRVSVVNKIGENTLCHSEGQNTLTVFVGYDNKNVAIGQSTTFDTSSGGFGVQENGWYWRGKNDGQNPDNAGAQVNVAAGSCSATMAASWAGGAVPDARQLLSVSSYQSGGGCTVEVYRQSHPSLCVAGQGAKQCCAPCSLFPGGNCCTFAADGGQHTCFSSHLNETAQDVVV